ncbi:MAG: hypothetical protein KDA61_13255 [Planctomycetales bacterium]|nr:hypothetical protein [Planctomycetales bacterium]
MMKRVHQLLVVVAALATWSIDSGTAHAQLARPTRYQAAIPTTSPYLNLLNNNGGNFATNYYSIIRPQLRQNEFNQQQAAAIKRQSQDLQGLDRTLRRDLGQPEELRPTGKAGWFNAGTPRNQFQNRSHYYFRFEKK